MTPRAMLTALTLAAVAAAGLSTTLHAQGMGGAAGPLGREMGPSKVQFSQIDTNGDKTITADELKAWEAKQIDALDANKNGGLTEQEVVNFQMKQAEARIKARVAAMFKRMDVNGDGKISAAEMMLAPRNGMLMRVFQRADVNHDGKVTQAEWDKAQAGFARMTKHRGERGDRGHHGHRGSGDRDGRPMMGWNGQGQPGAMGQNWMGQNWMGPNGRPGPMGPGNCDGQPGKGMGPGQGQGQGQGMGQGMGPGQGMGQGQGTGQGKPPVPPAAPKADN